MSKNIPVRKWLLDNNYADVAALIDQIMGGWKAKGTKTRRNWWEKLAGDKNGNPCKVEGVTLPVLQAAQIRKGVPVTQNALHRSADEIIPQIRTSGRWVK